MNHPKLTKEAILSGIKTPGRKLTIGTLALRMEVQKIGLTTEQIARQLGVTPQTVRNVLVDNNRKPGIRRRIEDLLGKHFWSTEAEFAARQEKNQ